MEGLKIKMVGDWNRVRRALANLPHDVLVSARWGQKRAAEKLIKIVKEHINNQDLGWVDRSESTHSDDPRTLVDSTDYLNAIKVFHNQNVYYAGVRRGEFNTKGNRISDYALIHEYGNSRSPARPLWEPSLDEMGREHGLREIVMDAIYAKLKRLNIDGFDVGISI